MGVSIMRPITRETIVDRRQPLLRWSAVFAGAAISIALWMVLQMLGMGIGLAAVDLDNAGLLRDIGIGTTAWTCAAPLVAMFLGSMIAGRMAGTHERRVGATHGFVVWALTTLIGLATVVVIVTTLTAGAAHAVDATAGLPPQPGQRVTPRDVGAATNTVGHILLGAGATMLVGLAACALGGFAGVRKHEPRGRMRDPEDVRTIETPVVPPPVTAGPVVATPPAP
jgi:MFS family permease